jgi:hypothetical protein
LNSADAQETSAILAKSRGGSSFHLSPLHDCREGEQLNLDVITHQSVIKTTFLLY